MTSAKKTTYSLFLICGLCFASCKKEIPLPAFNAVPENFSQVFENFWNQMNVNYVYWDIDTTNWDAMYRKYKPIFAQLDLHNNSDVQKSTEYFRQMIDGLIDSHYYINFINTAATGLNIYPAMDRKEKDPGFHYPYPYLKVDSSYFDAGFVSGYDNANIQNQQPNYALCSIIRNKIIYFFCKEFSLYDSYRSTNENGVRSALQFFFTHLENPQNDIKGIIIDMRGNSGGNQADLNFFVGHFIDKPLHFGSTRYKGGNGRLDYTPWVDAVVNPWPGAKSVKLPIVVLADNFSASLSEAVAMAVQTLPNGTIVGERTWGATGPITENVVYNDGQFTVPDFMSVLTSSAEFKYLDNKIYEGIGFPPGVPVPFDLAALNNGDDLQLDTAIALME